MIRRQRGSLLASVLAFALCAAPALAGGEDEAPFTISDEVRLLYETGEDDSVLKPGMRFKDCPECPVMIVIPPGEFMMGSPEDEEGRDDDEGPQHLVKIEYPLAVGVYEVTVDQFGHYLLETGDYESYNCDNKHHPMGRFARCPLSENGRGYSPNPKAPKRKPITHVDWQGAKNYATWMAKKTGNRYRLLSESEWEYAARAGTETRFLWGDNPGSEEQCRHVNGLDQTFVRTMSFLVDPNYRTNAANCYDNVIETRPVGHYPPNHFGLHDMIGNVSEWVEDHYKRDYAGAPTNGSAWYKKEADRQTWPHHVARGGNWGTSPNGLRSANRRGVFSSRQSYVRYSPAIGMRLSREIDR